MRARATYLVDTHDNAVDDGNGEHLRAVFVHHQVETLEIVVLKQYRFDILQVAAMDKQTQSTNAYTLVAGGTQVSRCRVAQ